VLEKQMKRQLPLVAALVTFVLACTSLAAALVLCFASLGTEFALGGILCFTMVSVEKL
jgi:uncharacterized membrane protein